MRNGIRAFAQSNGGNRREPHGIHAPCILCERPAVFPADMPEADRVCGECRKTIDEAERRYPWPKDDAGGLDRLIRDYGLEREKDKPLCLRLAASIDGEKAKREQAERDDFDRGVGDRFE